MEQTTIINIHAHRYQTATIGSLAADLAKFQTAIAEKTIEKDQTKEISYKDKNTGQWKKRPLKYASFDNILKHTRPVLAANGLSVIQCLSGEYLETVLIHKSGEQIGILTPFAPMSGRGTSQMQNVGGGMTYLSRYAYKSLLGLSLEDDNDGDQQPTQEQQKPELPEEKIEDSALLFLKDGTLARVTNYYHVPEKMLVQIYCLARDIKQEKDKQKNATNNDISENEAEAILEDMAKAEFEN